MTVRLTGQIGHFFPPNCCFFMREKKIANAITFIVVYIFNTGKFEMMSFNIESQFPNVTLSFLWSFINVAVEAGYSTSSCRVLTV